MCDIMGVFVLMAVPASECGAGIAVSVGPAGPCGAAITVTP